MLGDDAVAVAPIERHLAYLTGVEGSRSTVEDVGEFVAWLRLPLMARVGVVAVLSCVEHRCVPDDGRPGAVRGERLDRHAARHGVDLGKLLTN